LRAARHIAVGAHPLDQALDQAEAAASALAALENLTWELIPT